MFPEDLVSNKNSFVFAVGFHLGLPLSFMNTSRSHNWSELSILISEKFSNKNELFSIVKENFDNEIKFPLGNPIILKHNSFQSYFNIYDYLKAAEYDINEEEYLFDNQIWILPTGIVLIIGILTIKNGHNFTLSDFEDRIIETHYPELSFIFIQLAKTIHDYLPTMFSNTSSLICTEDNNKIKHLFKELTKSGISLNELDQKVVLNYAPQFVKNNSLLLSDILTDVYYFHYKFDANNEFTRIGYVDSVINSSEPVNILYICISFSSFVGFLWIIKKLREQTRQLQNELVGDKKLPSELSKDLKLFRIFCLQFINESSPINVRLTGYYMVQLEKCWKEFRLSELTKQINDQLHTVESIVDWLDDNKKESKNFKIGVAAIILALISVSAVTAQILSTIDFANTVQWQQRLIFITVGFLVGILFTVFIYRYPKRRK